MFKKISPVVAIIVVAAVVVCTVMMLRMHKNEGFNTSQNEVMDNALTDFIKESADADNSKKIKIIPKLIIIECKTEYNFLFISFRSRFILLFN